MEATEDQRDGGQTRSHGEEAFQRCSVLLSLEGKLDGETTEEDGKFGELAADLNKREADGARRRQQRPVLLNNHDG